MSEPVERPILTLADLAYSPVVRALALADLANPAVTRAREDLAAERRKETTVTTKMSAITGEPMVPVLYLDIDGTVREGKDDALGKFVNGPDDVVVFPQAVAQMRAWRAKGGRIIGVSNQGGVALGLVSTADVVAAMYRTNELTGRLFDKMAWCEHHPDAKEPEMARCWCRKPRIGLVIEGAASLSELTGEVYPPYLALFVGDRPEDMLCAEAAGIDFMWAATWRAQVEK